MTEIARLALDRARRLLPTRDRAPAEHHERRTSLRHVLDERTIDHTTATSKPKRRKGNDHA